MRNKDTGEFELVVGDKQLLMGFFIGVLLMGVVFAMGYVVGQSVPKSAKVAADAAPANNAADAHPQTAAAASPEPAAPTQSAEAAPSTASSEPPAEAPPQPTTVPARDPNAPAPAPAPKAAPAAEATNANYWQVHAGSQSSADAMSQTLKSRGFPVSTRPGPNSLTVVWVGPFTDKESLSRAKKQLEDAGLKPIRRP